MIIAVINAFKSYFDSIKIINELKLWKYFSVPIIISVITAVMIGTATYFLSSDLGTVIAELWPWEFGKETFLLFGNFFSAMVIILAGLILYKYIVLAISSPFMGPVSQKIENHLYGEKYVNKNTSFSESLVRGIRINGRNLIWEIILTFLIVILGLVPLIGVFSSILLILVQAYYAGFGNMDYTLERHYNYKDSIAFVKENKGVAIGNGIVFMLFLIIPIIGVILVLPFSVTAATSETLKKIHSK